MPKGKLYNLARVSTATTGTGTVTLGSAVLGFLTFAQAGVSTAEVVSYGIRDGTSTEVGTGTYTLAGLTLTRTVTRSTNSNNPITLSGSAEVYITARAEDLQTNTITPEQYGALGDGATDDTTALQNFLNACSTLNAIGVFMPGKTYMFGTQAAGLFVKSNTRLIGNGATLKALVTAPANYSSLNVTDATQGTAAGPSVVTIEGLTFNGNATARRAGGAITGVGGGASVYCVNATLVFVSDCYSLDSEGDGFYFGGDSTTGGPGFYFGFANCRATASSRNGYAVVGGNRGSFVNCIATSIRYGVSVGNISCGWDFEPNGATSLNDSVHCISCHAIDCDEGFGYHNVNSRTTNCNWVSCTAEQCTIGFSAGTAAGNIRIFDARTSGNTTDFTNINSWLGYTTGDGGAVTQATSKSTGVTLNRPCGAITMNGATLNTVSIVSFTLTNNTIAATDVLVLNHISGGNPSAYTLNAQCAAGSATINIRNNTASNLSDAIVIQFAVVKAFSS